MIPSQPLDPAALFARLAEGRAARTTVVTPNARLARALEAEADRRQLAAGRRSWEAPDILPFADFVRRCHEDALYGDAGAGLPALLKARSKPVEKTEETPLWDHPGTLVLFFAILTAEWILRKRAGLP